MPIFGFQKRNSQETWWIWMQRVHPLYLLLMMLWYAVFSLTSFVWQAAQGDIGSSPESFLGRIAVYASPVHPEISKLLYHMRQIIHAVRDKQQLFPDYHEHLSQIFLGIRNANIPLDIIEEKMGVPVHLARSLAAYEDDIVDLLGKKEAQTYLIILQNTAEKRPNGGFFGSFGVVTLDKGLVERFEIIDSYLPGFDKPGTYVTGPEWLMNFLPEREIYFVGANKIGFTYHDGAYIQALYEKSYPGQQVRGVIFVSTDLFTQYLSGFRWRMREWQFINASVDLIRGNDAWGKKSFYLNSASTYFKENKELLAKTLLTNISSIISNRHINVYLTNISGGFHTWLRESKLTTRFEDDHMYFRDSNISYSKVDGFAQKIIQFRNADGTVVKETMNDIVYFGDLLPGNYTIAIIYNLHVPQYYIHYMHELEKKYGITLNERETHILALDPTRATRGVVYMPDHVHVRGISGDHYHEAEFTTPFSRNLYYKAKMRGNNQVIEVVIKVGIE